MKAHGCNTAYSETGKPRETGLSETDSHGSVGDYISICVSTGVQ